MNENQLGVILEDMSSKMDGVVDAVGQLQNHVKNLPTRDEFNELRDDVRTIKQVVTNHDQRITQLETAR
jgi:hypothetical protein